MRQLTFEEINQVSGGIKDDSPSRQYDWVPRAQSDWGIRLNDVTNMLGEAGGWIGRSIYDWTH
jgi:hypothetical protein